MNVLVSAVAYLSIYKDWSNEHIGFSSNTDSKHYSVVNEEKKLTIEEMNR